MRIGRGMRIKRAPVIIVRATLSTVATLLLCGGTAVPAQARPDAPKLFWRWSDGSDAIARTFDETHYRIPARLPRLIVSTDPVTAGQLVTLQFDDDGTWRTDDRSRTSGSGIAALEFNPFCVDGDWCSRTYAYRLIVNGVSTTFTITYAN